MHSFIDALCILRPVYWLLTEAHGHRSWPVETDVLPRPDVARDNGQGVFIAPNELGKTKNAKGNLRHESNVIRFTSVFVDMDTGTLTDQRTHLDRFVLPPSIIIRTGRGHHAYWILDRFEPVDPDTWKRVQKEMARLLAGDPACVDPARLMRMPGTWHVKNDPKLVQLIHINEHWQYLLSEFPGYAAQAKTFILPARSSGRRIVNDPREPVVRIIPEGERHAALVKETARYLNGVAPSEVEDRRAVLKAWYAQSSRPLKPYWQREVDDMIEWVLKKELGNFNPRLMQ